MPRVAGPGRPKGQTKSGGRKAGTPNKVTSDRLRAIIDSGVSPLEYLLGVMRAEMPSELIAALRDCPVDPATMAALMGWQNTRFEAAKAAAPYCHPRLQTTTVQGSGDDGALIIRWANDA